MGKPDFWHNGKMKDEWAMYARSQMSAVTRQLEDKPDLESLTGLPPILDNLFCTVAVRILAISRVSEPSEGQKVSRRTVTKVTSADGMDKESLMYFQDWVATVQTTQGMVRLPPLCNRAHGQLPEKMPYKEIKLVREDTHLLIGILGPEAGSDARYLPLQVPVRAQPGTWHQKAELMELRPGGKAECAVKVSFEFHYASGVADLQTRDAALALSTQAAPASDSGDAEESFMQGFLSIIGLDQAQAPKARSSFAATKQPPPKTLQPPGSRTSRGSRGPSPSSPPGSSSHQYSRRAG